ncbi:MAG: F0F1 ATP synthase subunit gamma [Pseudomonadota bacterium]
MAQAREIKTKINTVKSTQKITRAMEMVAASKLHKAQQRMLRSRPYAEKICQVIHHISSSSTEYQHPFLIERAPKRIGYIFVSSDRGLCGGLNTNLFKLAIKDMQQESDQGRDIDLCLIGAKAEQFFKRHGGNILAQVTHIGYEPTLMDIIGTVKAMLDAYGNGEVDVIKLCFNRFVNTMVQKPSVNQLLPLIPEEHLKDYLDEKKSHRWDYIYEPDAKFLLDLVLKRYVESQVYQAVIENIACKHAAQMVAMKNATDNAGKIMDNLKLAYNKARQAAITRELAEIVAGAEILN